MRRILHAVKGWISKGASSSRKSAIVYVYSPGKDLQNGELSNNDQLAILRRLSSYASKEDTPVIVILPGRPSRKIPDGSNQNGVTVHYATADQLQKAVSSAIDASRGERTPVLAANQPDLEKMAQGNRIKHIRASTFEEALDMTCGPLRREQPPQQQRRPAPQQQPAATPQATAVPRPAPPSPEPKSEPSLPAELQVAETVPPPPADEPPAEPAGEQAKAEPVQRKLHRHEPSARVEIKDKAILDLIDPL